MRRDENGHEVPGTLVEYRALCASLGGESCAAVAFLDRRIARDGDQPVITPDSQMRALLMPLLVRSSTMPG